MPLPPLVRVSHQTGSHDPSGGHHREGVLGTVREAPREQDALRVAEVVRVDPQEPPHGSQVGGKAARR